MEDIVPDPKLEYEKDYKNDEKEKCLLPALKDIPKKSSDYQTKSTKETKDERKRENPRMTM